MITLKTLGEHTAQEVFYQVAHHMLEQNQQATENGKCLYLTNEGLKCAAGCLIAQDEYSEEFETRDWSTLEAMQLVPSYHFELIRNLQTVHDNYSTCDWRDQLEHVAHSHGLEMVI